MILKEKHKKHGNLKRGNFGRFGRNEVAILGTTCDAIQEFAVEVRKMFPYNDIAFVDADHHPSPNPFEGSSFQLKSNALEIKMPTPNSEFENKIHLSQSDLIVVNGNHFEATSQIIICNHEKENSLRKRAPQLTNVKAIVLPAGILQLPDYVKEILPNHNAIPIIESNDKSSLQAFFESSILIPADLKALILAGGKSTRMGKDKASIVHHEDAQFLHIQKLLDNLNIENFISCRAEQREYFESFNCKTIPDALIDMGPLGGIISAFMKYPENAWLVIATDIPLIDNIILNELITQRNSSKTATCFKSPFDGLPEPLISIWEPKSYMRIMEFLAHGYDCPRKVLINTNSEIIEPKEPKKLTNVNTPDDLSNLQKLRF